MTRRMWFAAWAIALWAWVVSAWALETPADSGHALRLARLAAREQAILEQRGVILHDAALSPYLQAVCRRLWEQVQSDLENPVVQVVADTRTEAYAYPNGICFVTTGMIDQLENEDQLAMILAHELVHYARRHTVALYRHLRQHRSGWDAPAGDTRQAIAALDGEQIVGAAELQADREGVSIMLAAGYRGAEALRLMDNLLSHARQRAAPAFLENLENRIVFLKECIGAYRVDTAGSKTDTRGDSEQFLSRIVPALMANAQAALREGDWIQADRSLYRFLGLNPIDARAYYLKGEIQRSRSTGTENNPCIGSYEQALKIDPTFPPAHRALGELHFKAGRYRKAKTYFETFLTLSPQDESSGYIKGYLSQCRD